MYVRYVVSAYSWLNISHIFPFRKFVENIFLHSGIVLKVFWWKFHLSGLAWWHLRGILWVPLGALHKSLGRNMSKGCSQIQNCRISIFLLHDIIIPSDSRPSRWYFSPFSIQLSARFRRLRYFCCHFHMCMLKRNNQYRVCVNIDFIEHPFMTGKFGCVCFRAYKH